MQLIPPLIKSRKCRKMHVLWYDQASSPIQTEYYALRSKFTRPNNGITRLFTMSNFLLTAPFVLLPGAFARIPVPSRQPFDLHMYAAPSSRFGDRWKHHKREKKPRHHTLMTVPL